MNAAKKKSSARAACKWRTHRTLRASSSTRTPWRGCAAAIPGSSNRTSSGSSTPHRARWCGWKTSAASPMARRSTVRPRRLPCAWWRRIRWRRKNIPTCCATASARPLPIASAWCAIRTPSACCSARPTSRPASSWTSTTTWSAFRFSPRRWTRSSRARF